ncbi:hypothetical protein L596_004495 [Steinernema carpocapsae]|uniref:Uncharacterized protein n=1 Tax=Steinernema carpocapsae TaxID=34508 RepID=A0A4U8UW37_STECR|nr:hypothetical protein L596_004495 [Steinernema carpocapsae]
MSKNAGICICKLRPPYIILGRLGSFACPINIPRRTYGLAFVSPFFARTILINGNEIEWKAWSKKLNCLF